ncbi:MAG: fumarylacetoacetate hydrolase family protein [Acidobacteria bacterium]|nr:fumarylacetoacetate hydrolase family protein [Acidobacteriota bacterium]
MRIVRYWDPGSGKGSLSVVQGDDVVALSGLFPNAEITLEALLAQAAAEGCSVLDLIKHADLSGAPRMPYASLDIAPDRSRPYLLQPVVAEEIWGAGVTYERSRHARQAESVVGDIYQRVYDAARPELFFKATPSRSVGPNEPVGLRGDSRWTVPEPELALVIAHKLEIVGYTLGNDMSARDIEGENPLYLPQAKMFTGGCSVGPAIFLKEAGNESAFRIACRVERAGREIFRAETSTAAMHRSFSDLVKYLDRFNTLPTVTILLTGAGIVPPDDFGLQDGDIIEISSPEIGTLRNPARLLT